MAASPSSSSKLHPSVMIFPFMAQGHTIPLLDISNAFASRGVQVTIITTPKNAAFVTSKTSNHAQQISLAIIPFPRIEGIPEGCENMADLPTLNLLGPFVGATGKMKQSVENILHEMSKSNSLPICLISDQFLGWTLETCRSFNIPRISFDGMGVLPNAFLTFIVMNALKLIEMPDSDSFEIPNLKAPFSLTKRAFPPNFSVWARPGHPLGEMMRANKEIEFNSWGSIINSFEELEGEYVPALQFCYPNGGRAWCVGPALLYDESNQDEKKAQSTPYIKWLEGFGSHAVVYISFGSQDKLSNEQLDEMALGLEMSGQPFIWVNKSKTWSPPEGLMDRINEKGLVLHEWVDQRSILSHPSTGGFFSHCGWNSVLESLTAGVPLLAKPAEADQKVNAEYVSTGLRFGMVLSAKGFKEGETIDRQTICGMIKKLMIEEEGRKARERAQELREVARKSVQKGGLSYASLDELIECLTQRMNTE